MGPIEIRGESVRVVANGLRHRVLRYGRPGDPDLLVLPGITSPAVTADFLASRFAGWGYRVSVPDIRGRGESERAGPGRYRLVDYAADVAALVETLQLRTPAVLGHSMGARIAAGYAVRHASPRHGPLVLVDPPLSGPGRVPYPTSKKSFLDQLRQAQLGTTAEEVRRFYPNWPERELRLRAEVLASCDETAVLETHDGFEREDFFADWARLTAPVALVRGERSPVVPPEGAAELSRARPDIDMVTVAAAGHMVPWDKLAGFLRALARYLPGRDTRRPA